MAEEGLVEAKFGNVQFGRTHAECVQRSLQVDLSCGMSAKLYGLDVEDGEDIIYVNAFEVGCQDIVGIAREAAAHVQALSCALHADAVHLDGLLAPAQRAWRHFPESIFDGDVGGVEAREPFVARFGMCGGLYGSAEMVLALVLPCQVGGQRVVARLGVEFKGHQALAHLFVAARQERVGTLATAQIERRAADARGAKLQARRMEGEHRLVVRTTDAAFHESIAVKVEINVEDLVEKLRVRAARMDFPFVVRRMGNGRRVARLEQGAAQVAHQLAEGVRSQRPVHLHAGKVGVQQCVDAAGRRLQEQVDEGNVATAAAVHLEILHVHF